MSLRVLRYALVLISLGAVVPAIACNDDDDGGDEALKIVRLEHEDLLFYNGDRLPLTVHWSGAAEFPVTVSLSVREGDCPKDVNCVDEEHEISVEANPIVVQEALWCTGQGDAI